MITLLEYQLLKRILEDDYQDVSDIHKMVGNPIWAQGIATTKAEGGALSSLIQKGFVVFVDMGDPTENTLWITQEGLNQFLDDSK